MGGSCGDEFEVDGKQESLGVLRNFWRVVYKNAKRIDTMKDPCGTLLVIFSVDDWMLPIRTKRLRSFKYFSNNLRKQPPTGFS